MEPFTHSPARSLGGGDRIGLLPKSDRAFDIEPGAVIEAAAESILVTTADLDAPGPSIVYANSAFETMTGWSKA
ncbi:MAG: PAS domain-containing protein, partial [Geminicoccaceae bacterium]